MSKPSAVDGGGSRERQLDWNVRDQAERRGFLLRVLPGGVRVKLVDEGIPVQRLSSEETGRDSPWPGFSEPKVGWGGHSYVGVVMWGLKS